MCDNLGCFTCWTQEDEVGSSRTLGVLFLDTDTESKLRYSQVSRWDYKSFSSNIQCGVCGGTGIFSVLCFTSYSSNNLISRLGAENETQKDVIIGSWTTLQHWITILFPSSRRRQLKRNPLGTHRIYVYHAARDTGTRLLRWRYHQRS